MPTIPLREAAIAAIAARLTEQMPDVAIERARRSPIVVEQESLPRIVVRGEEMGADDSQEPGRTHYTISVSISAVTSHGTDMGLEQALSLLHARIVDALAGWTPSEPGLGDLAEQEAEFRLYDLDESERPAGEVLARFSMLAVSPTGGAWSV